LVQSIEQVLALEPAADEVLVVDQTVEHSAATAEFLARQVAAGRIRVIPHSPANLPAARNHGVRETDKDILIFIDDDVLLPKDFVEQHRAVYRDGKAMSVSGQVFQPASYRQELAGDVLSGKARKEEFGHFKFDTGAAVDFLRGCNFSVRRKAFVEVGGFDENFLGAAYGEDHDFAARLGLHGLEIQFSQGAWVVHLKVPSGGCRIPGNKAQSEWGKTMSMMLFAFRHGVRIHQFGYYFKAALFAGPLRKENVLHAWRLPWAWLSWGYAMWEAWKRARGGVRSCFS
jgi:GT2 family glycosyltransferase